MSAANSDNDLAQRLQHRLTSAAALSVDFVAYCIVRILVAVIQTLPLDMGDSVCRFLAWLAAGPLRVRRQTTEANLQRVFPDADAQTRKHLSYAMWHHLLLMVCEIAWAQRRLHRTNWSQGVIFRDNRKILGYLLADKPLVMVTGHFGNFEIGGYVTGLMGFSSLTIARRLDNRFIHRWVERFRGAKGQYMVDKHGCAPEVERHLQQGGILSLLADQHAGPKGCWVDFMGVPASCHKVARAVLAQFQGADACRFDPPNRWAADAFRAELRGVADPENDVEGVSVSVKTLTEWYNRRLAVAIGQSLEQYWWLHRRWREPPERVAKRLSRAA